MGFLQLTPPVVLPAIATRYLGPYPTLTHRPALVLQEFPALYGKANDEITLVEAVPIDSPDEDGDEEYDPRGGM